MRRTILIATLVSLGCNHPATPSPPVTRPVDPALADANVVQSEMRLLNEAMRDAVTALALGRPGEIPASLERVHAARERTDDALESGKYVLPKNAARLEAFQALDGAFHEQLERLVVTSRTKDVEATATQLGVVLGRCDGCHVQFRP